MEISGLKQTKNQRYNFIQMPEFKNSLKSKNNDFNYLSQSQTIPKKNNENPMLCSISDKIKLMKEELKKDDITNGDKKYNNDFKLRLERISKRGTKTNNENQNNNNRRIFYKKWNRK